MKYNNILVSCYLSLGFSSKVSSVHVLSLGNSEAATHVAADLQRWYTVKLGKNKKRRVKPSGVGDFSSFKQPSVLLLHWYKIESYPPSSFTLNRFQQVNALGSVW